MTKEDKLLQAVLSDLTLRDHYDYDPNEYTTLGEAEYAPEPIVRAVAMIIKGLRGINGSDADKAKKRTAYDTVFNYLKTNL